MSVSLSITFPGRENESLPMCGQRSFENWVVGTLGSRHGFKFFAGPCPLFIWDQEHLDQAIFEMAIIRDEQRRLSDANPKISDEDRAYETSAYDLILARLHRLKNEQGWKADFG